MIEQQDRKLILTFLTADSATTFAAFLRQMFSLAESSLPADLSSTTALSGAQADSAISSPPSEPSLETVQPPLVSPEPELLPQAAFRSRHTVLTPERQDQLFNQRAAGMSANQRLLRAQTTLRDGVLPFSKPGQTPAPSGQPSPRQRAQTEGGFADGAPKAPALRLTVPADPALRTTLSSEPPAGPKAPAEGPRRSRLRPVLHSPRT